jgi:Zn-dependent M16 (insulinase) family peptidase
MSREVRMEIRHGFELLKDVTISELRTQARLYRHVKTGAELLSLINNDENKVFGITFRTPPDDSSGLPHILEHSVLCGSRKYPVKEPFVEILKGSLQTFLNAFTYPDKTCYPVASQNVQDFYNLIDVYLDAVFYPRISPFIFQQEGWHYELKSSDDPIIYKGVVFNEMKGAYSSPQRLIATCSQQSLFPDNSYGLDSGGDPERIPYLSFEKFSEFHRNYYHPSNARIFFSGDDEPDQRLHLVDEYLKDFDRLDTDSAVPLQQSFDGPKRFIHSYASGEDEASESKGMVTINWLLTETIDAETNMALHILSYILLGMPGSPLRKALIDSGLGEDLTGAGLEDELRQMYFSVGLKGIHIEKADVLETLIIETLTDLVKNRIDPRTIEASLNTVEFRLRENNTGNYPRGLVFMLRSLTTWLYDGDPLLLLQFESYLSTIRSQLQRDTAFFENLIDRFFLSNSHRTTVILQPDATLGQKTEEAERNKLADAKAAMSDDEVRLIIENTHQLQQLQETPDNPEALASIPVLKLGDLDKENKIIPLERFDENETRILYHNLETNGINYIDVGFDLHTLPQNYLPYVPLFGRALLQMGTGEEDFVTLSQRISRKTGGIRPTSSSSVVKDSKETSAWLFLRGKGMLNQVEDLFQIVNDVLLSPGLDNKDRFKQMVLEEKARQEQKMIPGGHQIVNLRLRSHFSEAGWAAEQMSGISYLFFLRKLVEQVDQDWPSVLAVLRDILFNLVNRASMIVNVTTDDEGWSSVRNHLLRFLSDVPIRPEEKVAWSPGQIDDFEGMTIPAQVNYVGKGADLYNLGYRYHGSARVISRYLRTSWLWDRVRVHGGAYGAFCQFNSLSGVLTFLSYRDPNLARTLSTFDETATFLRQTDLNREELTKGIIGAIGEMDTYMLPDTKGYTSLLRYLNGDDDRSRQRTRDEILSTTINDFRAFADVLDGVKEIGLIKVLGSARAIENAVKNDRVPLKVLDVL